VSRTTIYLHRADLVERRACEEGLALFDEFAAAQGRRQSLRIPLAGLLWAACDPRTRSFLGWAQDKSLLPRVSALGADLRSASLAGANLRSADLRSADLEGADLTDAYLEGADLYGADLRSADLRSANLYGADLTGARRWSNDPPIAGWKLRNGVLVQA
jgi:uncharacterized protein YjbI with pentapeptide repeats